jgi:hypothetical protein
MLGRAAGAPLGSCSRRRHARAFFFPRRRANPGGAAQALVAGAPCRGAAAAAAGSSTGRGSDAARQPRAAANVRCCSAPTCSAPTCLCPDAPPALDTTMPHTPLPLLACLLRWVQVDCIKRQVHSLSACQARAAPQPGMCARAAAPSAGGRRPSACSSPLQLLPAAAACCRCGSGCRGGAHAVGSGGEVAQRDASGGQPSYSRAVPLASRSSTHPHRSCSRPCQSGCSTRRGKRPPSHHTEPPAARVGGWVRQ